MNFLKFANCHFPFACRISDGELANEGTFRGHLAEKDYDNTMTGKQDLENTDTESGDSVENLQREVNSLNSVTGRTSGSAKDAKYAWNNNDVGASTDSIAERADNLTEKFNPDVGTGHRHTGAAGDAPPVSAAELSEFNNFFADWQTFQKNSASGTSLDVSTSMTGKVSGGTSAQAGVYTSAPDNRVVLTNSDSQTAIEDANGQRVYGRITESSGVWTLSFYTLEAGVETAHSLSSQNINVFFSEVFTAENRPTRGADLGQIPSLDLTADIVDATTTQRGLVSTGTQAWAGNKSTTGTLSASNLSGTNTGDQTITLTGDVTGSGTGSFAATIANDAVTNAKAANMATQTFKGRTTAGTGDPEDLTVAQAKTLLSLAGSNNGDVTLATIGSTPAAEGASLSTQVLTLQPANGTFGGVLTAIAQTIAGLKTFAAGVVAQTIARLEGWFETDSVDDNTSGSAVTLSEPAKHVVRLTNASLVSITGITAPSDSKVRHQVLVNRTGVSVNILNDSGTAANRILTGTAATLALAANASIALVYDPTTGKWQVTGGSGSGSTSPLTTKGDIYAYSTADGRFPVGTNGHSIVADSTQTFGLKYEDRRVVVVATENISAAGTVTAAANLRELRRVQGNGAAVTASATTALTNGTIEGTEVILKGMSDTNTVTIPNSGNMLLNGDMTLFNGSTLHLMWVDSAWIELARRV